MASQFKSFAIGTFPGFDKSYQRITILDDATHAKWVLPALYKINSLGKLDYWQIGFNGTNLLTYHGREDGVIDENTHEIILNNSGRSLEEQSLLEGRQRYKLKYKDGYLPKGSTERPLTKPMKGYVYEEKHVKQWPVYIQPKLDGIRMLTSSTLTSDDAISSITMYSYKNNEFKSLDHLKEDIQGILMYLPEGTTLDGELYNHDMSFQEITSAVKTYKEKHPRVEEIQYWVFDINYPDAGPYESRYDILFDAYMKYIQETDNLDPCGQPRTLRLLHTFVAYNDEDVKSYHDMFVENNYEGAMVKQLALDAPKNSKLYNSSLYKFNRSYNILKVKNFQDEEGTIIGIKEGKGTEKGLAIFVVRDPRGNIIEGIRMKGSFDRRRYWFEHPDEVMGKKITYKFQRLTNDGIPYIPVGKEIRDYE